MSNYFPRVIMGVIIYPHTPIPNRNILVKGAPRHDQSQLRSCIHRHISTLLTLRPLKFAIFCSISLLWSGYLIYQDNKNPLRIKFELKWTTYQPICAVVLVAEAPDSIFRYGDGSFPRLPPEQSWAKSPTSFPSCPAVGSNACEKDYRLYSYTWYAINY